MAEVIGTAFLGITKFIKETRGQDFLKEVIEAAGPEVTKIFSKRIIAIAWFPYTTYIAYLHALDRKMGRGDLIFCRKAGEEAAKKDMATIYATYKDVANPERLIKDAALVWKSYYRDAGFFNPVSWDPNNTLLRITEFPDMAPAHCRLMEGWMTESMRIVGAKIISEVREVQCMSKGGPYHEFTCKWSR